MRLRLRVAAFLASAIVGVPRLPAQQPGGECHIPNFPAPQLCARAGLDTVRARYILMVDESASMTPLWPAMRRALTDFAAAIPEGDELDVRAFSGDAHSLIPTAPASANTRASWRRTFLGLPAPNGRATDLGAAAAAALQAARNADSAQVQFIFFFTDGRHQPQKSSPYAASTSSAPWQQLVAAARTMTTARPVSIAIVRLTPDADPGVLRTVFPSAVLSDALDEGSLHQWLLNSARDAAVGKLIALINRELSRPVATLESTEPLVTHSNRFEEHAVRSIQQRRILTTALRDSSTVRLRKGGQIVPSARLWSTPTPELELAGPRRALWTPPASLPSTVDESLPIATQVGPADELGRIGLAADARTDSLHLRFAERSGGPLAAWLYWTAVALLAAVALWVARRVRHALHRPTLDGHTVIVRRLDDPQSSAKHSFAQRREATVPGSDGREVLRIEARNEGGRTVIYAVPLAPEITFREKPVRSPIRLGGRTVFNTAVDEVTYL